jgi:hypothetical protein
VRRVVELVRCGHVNGRGARAAATDASPAPSDVTDGLPEQMASSMLCFVSARGGGARARVPRSCGHDGAAPSKSPCRGSCHTAQARARQEGAGAGGRAGERAGRQGTGKGARGGAGIQARGDTGERACTHSQHPRAADGRHAAVAACAPRAQDCIMRSQSRWTPFPRAAS